MDFSEKNILVAGGSSGIGLSLVNHLAAKGAVVYNLSRHESAAWNPGVKHLAFDVLEDLSLLGSQLPDKIHGLVYSVGSINLKPFNRISEEDMINDYRLNVTGALKVIQQALKSLKNAGGASIILISSVAAQTGMAYHASIAAAKSGVEGFAISLAAELAAQNIRVNVVAPSLTDTPLAQNLLNTPEKQAASAKRHPLGRVGTPNDIAHAIIYLLSDDASWITGQVLGINGGLGNLKTA